MTDHSNHSFHAQCVQTLEQIRPHILYTPVIKSKHFSNKYKKNIYFKLECMQHTGSFKARGAMAKCLDVLTNNPNAGFATASGGNHGLGVCYAAQQLNRPAHCFLFESVSDFKKAGIKSLGANLHIHGTVWDEANVKAQEFARENNLAYVHPFDDYTVVLGQGTLAVELVEQMKEGVKNVLMTDKDRNESRAAYNDDEPAFDAVVCSIGGGGLISGVSSIVKHATKDRAKVFGVETVGAASMYKSVQARELITLDRIDSICEGLGAKRCSDLTLGIVMKNVDKCYLVEDKQAMDSLRELLQYEKIFAEPSTTCSLAGLEQIIADNPELNNIVVIICGSNFPIDKISMFQ